MSNFAPPGQVGKLGNRGGADGATATIPDPPPTGRAGSFSRSFSSSFSGGDA